MHKRTILFFAIFSMIMGLYLNCRADTVRIKGNYLYDNAHILEGVEEYSNKYLKNIREQYSIEAMIVSLPSLEREKNIEELAIKVFNTLKIGQDFKGRGILLLLVDKEKQAKLEVSYELEDVFTDAFCGYIEDLQLRPYFLSNQVGIGLLAVMEELERRAQIKFQANYSPDYVAKLDKGLLSGGAGAKRDLAGFEKEEVKDAGHQYPAGKTPQEAWQTLIESWREKVRDPNLGVYTEITKLTYRDYQNLPDSRYEEDVRTYAGKSYEVIQDGNYAVIFFGNKQGWDNSPFLFCRTPEGWKFDIVHQRKYIRMGASPNWGIERANFPYIDLLSGCPYWMGQDIPLEGEDIYRVEDDKIIAKRIVELEQEFKESLDDFSIAMELGRLYTIVSMGQKAVRVLNKAKQLNPQSPLPYKYLAVENVDANYQYNTAIKELKEYVRLKPEDAFGHNFLGYLYFCTGNYEEAVKELNKAAQLKPDNPYAYCQLSRAYGQLYLGMSKIDLRRNKYKGLTLDYFKKAQNTVTPDQRRIGWLRDWLREKGIIN
jgi:tetratricopeptide (TPR) repeat protein